MYAELHDRIAGAGYPIAGLTAAANRLHSKDSGLTHRIDAAFVSDPSAQLGFGF